MFQSRVILRDSLTKCRLSSRIKFNIIENAREKLLFFQVREPNQRELKFLTMIISIFGYN